MNLHSLLQSEGLDPEALPFESEPAPSGRFEFEPLPAGTRLRAPSDFDKVFADAGAAFDVDPVILKSIAFAESGFDPDIISGKKRSRAGAIGLMQFMPDTAKEYDNLDPTNPVQSIFAAAQYMRKSLDKFGGDYGKAVASYNHGPNRDTYNREDWDQRVPPETQKYLMTVFDAAGRFKDGSAERGLPQGVTPSKAGAGRGSVSPGMTNTQDVQAVAPKADTLDAKLAKQGEFSPLEESGKGLQSGYTGLKQMWEANKVLKDSVLANSMAQRLSAFDRIDAGATDVPRAIGLAYQQADASGRAKIRGDVQKELSSRKDFIGASMETIRQYQAEQQRTKGRTTDLTDVGNLKDFGNWLAFNGASGVVSMAPLMVAAVATGPAAPFVTGALGYGMATGELAGDRINSAQGKLSPQRFSRNPDRYDDAVRAENQNVIDYVAKTAGSTVGAAVPFAALDVVAGPVGSLLKGAGKEMAQKGVKYAAKEIGKDTLEETATGGLQEVIKIATENALGEQDGILTGENLKRVINSAAAEGAGGMVGGAGRVGYQAATRTAPTVESQPTTPQVPPTVAPTTPVTPNAAKTQAVDNIAAAIKELEGGTTQAAPVQPGQQTADTGTAPVAQGTADSGGGLASAGEAAVAGQSESAQSLTDAPSRLRRIEALNTERSAIARQLEAQGQSIGDDPLGKAIQAATSPLATRDADWLLEALTYSEQTNRTDIAQEVKLRLTELADKLEAESVTDSVTPGVATDNPKYETIAANLQARRDGKSEQAAAIRTRLQGQPTQTVSEKGSAVIPSVETGQSMVQRLLQPATPEQEQTQADTVVAEKAKPAPAYTPAIPQPGQAEAIVGKAVESARKNADLADERMYSVDALQRIAAHPQANDELKAAATNEVQRRAGIEQVKQQQFEARRSGTVLSIPDAPPLRPLSVERGIEIAKASRERKLLPQEQGYMDALKAEIGDKAFDLVTRAGKAPFMTTMTERKFDLPRLLEQSNSALTQWDTAHNPAQKPTAAPKAAPTPAPAPTGIGAEMAALKARSQPAVSMNLAPALQAAQAHAVAPVVNQQMTAEAPAAPVAKQGKGKKAAQAVDAVASDVPPQTADGELPQPLAKKAAYSALLPYNIQGNKTQLLANGLDAFLRNAAKGARRVIDAFGGAAAYTHALAHNGDLPKGSIYNEFEPLRYITNKQIKENVEQVIARLEFHVGKIKEILATSEEQVVKRKLTADYVINGINSHKQDGVPEHAKGLKNPPSNMDDSPDLAALYLIAQNSRFGYRPIQSDVGEDGKLRVMADSENDLVSITKGGEKVTLFGRGKDKLIDSADNLRAASKRLQGVDVRMGDGWMIGAKDAAAGDVLLVDTSYLNKTDEDTGKTTQTANYNKATQEDAVPAVYKEKVTENLLPAWDRGAKIVITNNWDDDVVAYLKKLGFTVIQDQRAKGVSNDTRELIAINFDQRTGAVNSRRGTVSGGVTGRTGKPANVGGNDPSGQDGVQQLAAGTASQDGAVSGPGRGTDAGIKASRAPSSVSRHAELLREWLRGMPDAIDRIIRRNRDANKFDYELRDVPVADITPSQSGEDYLNDSSRETARQIATTKSIEDIGRKEDVLPIVLDENLNIIDGNHRHAASKLNGAKTIPALVRVGAGSGRIQGVEAWMDGVQVAGMKASRTAGAPQTGLTADKITKPIWLWHGSAGAYFSEFNTPIVFLTDDRSNASAFASDTVLNKGSAAQQRLYKVKVQPGDIRDIQGAVDDALLGEDDVDVDTIIQQEAERAAAEGVPYVSFMHPGVDGPDFRAIVTADKSKLSIQGWVPVKQSMTQPAAPRTQASTIRTAITKAYGNLLPRLEGKGLVTLTQTEEEAIAAAAQARADQNGGDVEAIKQSLRKSVLASVAPQTESANFKRWFAGSRVVDTDGNPLVVYHGSGLSISEFFSYRGKLIYFSKDIGTAESYAEYADENQREQGNYDDEFGRNSEDGGAAVYPVYLSVQNPFDPDSAAHLTKLPESIAKEIKRTKGDYDTIEQYQGDIEAAGFDGVYVREHAEQDATESRDIAVFSPTQIKSAIGNNGDFDGNNLDIRRSADGNLEGFFDPATGKSFLIADNLTAESAPATLMHEVGIHMAAEGKFGPMFDRALTVLNDGSLESTEALRRMQESGETSGEEAAAYLVTVYETNRTNAPASVKQWMKDMIAAVRAWLFSKGVIIKADQLTVADIAAVARANASRIAKGKGWVGSAQKDGAFRFGNTEGQRSKDIATVADEFSSDRIKLVGVDMDDGSHQVYLDGAPDQNMTVYPVASGRWRINAQDANRGIERSGDNAGQRMYQALFAWAHNNGHTVDAEFALSFPNELRRTSAMLSSALRFNTTDHLGEVDETQGIDGWKDGDFASDVQALADAELRKVGERILSLGDFTINKNTGVVSVRTDSTMADSLYQGRQGKSANSGLGESASRGISGADVSNGAGRKDGQVGTRPDDRGVQVNESEQTGSARSVGDGTQVPQTPVSDSELARYLARTRGGFEAHGVGVSTLKRALITRDFAGETDLPGLLYSVAGDTDIRRSVRGGGQQQLFPQQSVTTWDDLGDSKVDSLIYEGQDDRIDLKRVQENIAKAGRQVREEFDARMAETLFPGRVAKRNESFVDHEVKPLLQAMSASNVSMEELGDYLLARHAPERNAQIAKVNPGMPDGGAGTNSQGVLMTTQAAQDHIANLSAGKRTALQLLARQVDAITKGTREMLVTEGLEKASTVAAWEGAYQNYVPLFKDEAAETPGHPVGSGFSVKGGASKRAMGSTKEVTNVLAHVLMQREAAITRAEKNRVGMSLYGLALSNPNKAFWGTVVPKMSTPEIIAELQNMGVSVADAFAGMEATPTIRYVDPNTGLVTERPNPVYKNLDNALVVKVDGEDRVILFNKNNARAMRLAESLKNQNRGSGVFVEGTNLVAPVTRFMASMLTQYNPAFGMVNAVRDIQGALVNLSSTPLKGKQAKVLADVPAALKGIARDVSGNVNRTQWSDLWVQFQEDGGRTGIRDLVSDPYEKAGQIEKDLKRLESAGKLTPGNAAHAVLDLLSGFNDTLENGVRVAAYKAALDQGMSRPAAAKLARELTVDFNRKGRTGRELGKLYAFLNASVQGSARTIQTLKGPMGAKIMAGGFAIGVLQAFMLAAAGFDDDDIPEFIKSRNLIIPMGGDRYVTIPMALGLHVLPNTGRAVTELVMSGGKDIGTKSLNTLVEIVTSFNPFGGGGDWKSAHGPLTMVTPTVMDPVIDMAMNRDFTGRQISKERRNPGDVRPGATLARESTKKSPSGQVYIGLSELINKATLGTDVTKGAWSPTPEELRYMATVVGGGVYRETERAVNAAVLLARGEEVKPHQVPLGSRFAGTLDEEMSTMSRYYKNDEALNKFWSEFKAEAKDGNTERVAEMRKDPRYTAAAMNSKIEQHISKLNKLAGENVGDKAKYEALNQKRAELMRKVNEAVKEAESK